VISWFLSPLAAALIALIIFVAVRTVVLRRAKSTDIAFYVLPVLILITIWVVRAWRHVPSAAYDSLLAVASARALLLCSVCFASTEVTIL
jgi:phosphate/sulfate permease